MGKQSAKIGRQIRADLSRVLSQTMLAVVDNLISTTPVDTGHARNNWVLTTRQPYTSEDGSRVAPSDAAQRAGIAKIQNYDIGRDGPIYLRDNVRYMQFLDAGSSSQAPAGFVGACFRDAANGVRRGFKVRVKKLLRGMAKSAYRKGI